MENSKSDKQPFNAKAAVEAAKGNPGYYKSLTPHERLIIANYLNSIFYNYPENEPPRMDKTVFSSRKHE